MIGILLITHGSLGDALIDCAIHVLNRRPVNLKALAVAADEDPAAVLHEAQHLLVSLDEGEGVLVMTDIYGATPANIAMRLLRPGHVECVAGVNVPMLLRVLTYCEKHDIDALCRKAVSGGCEGVHHFKGSI
ncbi:MAG: PTS fructose transporter subunit IIA [Candidatus Dactylopiibacterium carminicum]|uniref:PTS fructose transporter subunit IIA n=1 Tax=Candidatus Dactylopiibacterium carminicum TaxID=857335 RepID=A0A272EWW0_9RHOO|nr:PTS fructose transporter subunit IIA [Candidatus Dactylopiibacterium carminicum]KAF7600008.1 PTS fructose transporter subunit IIA [Candidatus Dactylopiibacterium carminicum]PAS94602.1 MAG: PTS fructose transporter subunit IIA [Candidatus Dactylopiibacterium carminicum]PAS97641.1 MAG: PTS fructose transporter subunit IIA [Candidatus Dactylopiibacterium carminicum]PAT00013.1 MAG: PTS fructose transporter subunit IIA [Candidatus Dactylopiibacterium carminicum]